ncbi:family S53 protease [Dentipellis sp. KUC8613]|nr:family S53 protease [Dentipellis sp. KUC8613]
MRVFEKRDSAPRNFVAVGAASPDHPLSLRIGLAQSNFAGLEKALYDVSTPGNSKYGQHLSKQEVEAFVAPSPDTVKAVKAWLASHNLTSASASPAGDWLSINATVQQANELLSADFTHFEHVDTGKQAVRTLSYSLPDALHGAIQFVHPTTAFPRSTVSQNTKISMLDEPSSSPSNATGIPSSCASSITPQCLQAMYNIPKTCGEQSTTQLGVTGYVGQYANEQDLATFLQKYRPDLSSSTNFSVQSINGGENPQGSSQAGSEADLDIQYTVGVAAGVPAVFISVGNDVDEVDGFMDSTNLLLAQENPPSVVTTSYGYGENDFPYSLGSALCNAYAQLGARGVSMLFASGDEGVCGDQGTSCSNFGATFPSSCPYVTAIGATTGVPETGDFISGGGFSSWFPRPSYQSTAVPAFLSSLGSTYQGKYNASGRGFPDLAAAGENIAIVYQGQAMSTGGTSASSPIVASIVALLNDELISAGKAPLGFLNPFIYANPDAFNDITSGYNPGCFTMGFTAREGWDPVTGLGTPNYTKMKVAAGL